jgi:hypothetical protein
VLQSIVQRVESLYLEEGHWFLLEISLCSVIDEFYVLQSMVQRVESLYLDEGHWFLLEIFLFSH